MKKLSKNIWFPIMLSIILLVLFPINLTFIIYTLGVFYIIDYLAYIIVCLIPIIIIYKKNLSYKYYSFPILVGGIVFLLLSYYGTEYGKVKNIEESKKTFEIMEHNLKLMNERDVNKLEDKFKNIEISSNQDISLYKDDITKGTNEFQDNIGIINLEVYVRDDGYTKKKISINGDKKNFVYSYYINGDKLEGVRKIMYDKGQNNLNNESEKQDDCYTSTYKCSKDMLFLYDYIQKIKIDK